MQTGMLPLSELNTIWDEIIDEYRSISRDQAGDYRFTLYKEIYTSDKENLLITAIVNQLRLRSNPVLITMLQNDFNFHLSYVDLNADLDRTLKQLKSRIVRNRLAENDYKSLMPADSDEELTEVSMYEQIAVLAEAQHYYIDPDKTSVLEYVAILNNFKVKNTPK